MRYLLVLLAWIAITAQHSALGAICEGLSESPSLDAKQLADIVERELSVLRLKNLRTTLDEFKKFLRLIKNENDLFEYLLTHGYVLHLDDVCIEVKDNLEDGPGFLRITYSTQLDRVEFTSPVDVLIYEVAHFEVREIVNIRKISAKEGSIKRLRITPYATDEYLRHPIRLIELGGKQGINGLMQCGRPLKINDLVLQSTKHPPIISISCAVIGSLELLVVPKALYIGDSFADKATLKVYGDSPLVIENLRGSDRSSHLTLEGGTRIPPATDSICKDANLALLDVNFPSVFVYSKEFTSGARLSFGKDLRKFAMEEVSMCASLSISFDAIPDNLRMAKNRYLSFDSFTLEHSGALAEKLSSFVFGESALPSVNLWHFPEERKSDLLSALRHFSRKNRGLGLSPNNGEELTPEFVRRLKCAETATTDFQRRLPLRENCDPFANAK